ncbi:MAG: hypothetical protein SCALA702_08020 [Melioribacteraceae bacterium]|nr:MAG: hypothetical protein SCALA702_08020 [Melioribacteraceae bacterium]
MPVMTKYEFIMNELAALEKQVYMYVQKTQVLLNENGELKKKVRRLEKENKEFREKIESSVKTGIKDGADIPGLFDASALSDEERENLRTKITELIDKLDFHLRS